MRRTPALRSLMDIEDRRTLRGDLGERSVALHLSGHRYHAGTHIPTTTDDDDEGRASAWPTRLNSRGPVPLLPAADCGGPEHCWRAPRCWPGCSELTAAEPAQAQAPADSRVRGAGLTDAQRAHRGRHADRLRHGDQQRQADRHRRPRRSAGGPPAEHPLRGRRHRPAPGDLRGGTGDELGGKYTEKFTKLRPGRRRALQPLRAGGQARPRQGRRLPVRRLRSPARPRRSPGTRCSASSGPSCPGSRRTPTARPRRRSCGR